MKQETLEEVLPKNSNGKYSRNEIEKAFESGAKWQAERMYTEEELKSAFRTGFGIGYGSDIYAIDIKDKICDEWFEENKKK
jgi:hypothetical protein